MNASGNHFASRHIFEFEPIVCVLTTRKYQLIILGSALINAVVYMLAVGIISYYPEFAPLRVTTPVISVNSLGVMVVPGNYLFIFVFYSAIAFLLVSSFLAGLNIALMLYSRNLSRTHGHCKATNLGSRAIFGIAPAFFTTFSCCGGGLLAFALGPAAFSVLASYSGYMAFLTVAILAISSVIMTRKILQLKKSIITGCGYDFVTTQTRVQK